MFPSTKGHLLAVDFETKGFYGEIQVAQFNCQHWDAPVLVQHPPLLALADKLSQEHIVAHNVSYEISTVQQQLGVHYGDHRHYWVPADWEDTLLLAKLQFYQLQSYTLDACYEAVLGYNPYLANNIDKKVMQKADWSDPTPKMLEYAELDVKYLLDVYAACAEQTLTSNYLLTKEATKHMLHAQCNGLHFDRSRIASLRASNQVRIDELAVPVNVNSYQQVRPYIGEEESNGLALATYALEGNDKARDVQEARKLIKLNSFLTKFERESFNDRIFGKFTFTTKSGRGNCKDQNLQQLPRKTKGVFTAAPGHVLVMSDYAQLEIRYACAYTGESVMEQLFREGADLHQRTADLMGVVRQDAKVCNFNLLYGGSAKMLRAIFVEKANKLLPIEEVYTLKTKWHNTWPTLTKWQNYMIEQHRQGKPQSTTLRRKFVSKLYTDAMNLPIQGGSADIAKLALHKMYKEIGTYKFVDFIHDSFMWEVPDDPAIYKRVAQVTAKAMQDAWTDLLQYTKIPDLPMPVDVVVGHNWGDLESGAETPLHTLTLEG